MSVLATSGLRKTYRNRDGVAVALDDVSLEVAAGEFLALVGPSGCGKSTLLRTIAGLVVPDHGYVRFDGVDVTALPAPRRRVGFVFQGLALFEHLDVRANIGYGIRGVRGAAREAAVRRAAGLARIDGALGARPRELSGGERQRVALARALAAEPQLLLLDEPFTGLDAPLRADLRAELGRFVRETGTTSLIVTHDHADALGLGDRVAVMRAGAVVQVGTPREVYTRPASAFVGGFVGAPAMRFVSGAVREGAFIGPGGLALHGAVPARAVRAGVRAEAVRLDPSGLLRGRVALVEALGDRALAHVDGDFGTLLVALDGAAPGPVVGDAVALSIDARRASYFDAAGVRC